nr:hypothetical protein BaRGS_013175 [Batillaria attramentaria]
MITFEAVATDTAQLDRVLADLESSPLNITLPVGTVSFTITSIRGPTCEATNTNIDVCAEMGSNVCGDHGTCIGDLYEDQICECQAGYGEDLTDCQRQRRFNQFLLRALQSSADVPAAFLNGKTVLQQLMDLDYHTIEVSKCWDDDLPRSGKYHSVCAYNVSDMASGPDCFCTNGDGLANGWDYVDGNCRGVCAMDEVDCGQGLCLDRARRGAICLCPAGHFESLSDCQRQKRLNEHARAVLQDGATKPGGITADQLQQLLQAMNVDWLPLYQCGVDGSFQLVVDTLSMNDLTTTERMCGLLNEIGLDTIWKPECEGTGYANVACEYSVTDRTAKECYCVDENQDRRDDVPSNTTGLPDCPEEHRK